ncbi:MAG: hypothetical protein PHV53_02815 [Fermentimonas sp.]|nr:hypothetical protein [Fermentimonas sp.]
MKNYLTEMVFFFLLPAFLIAAVAEYSLRKIPNDYSFKNQWLTENSRDVEILALGASTILYDVDPAYFSSKGFNAAHFSQSLKYDHFIYNKYIDRMPSLEYVIMGIDFWSPFGDMENSPEWWRVKYYNIHYGGNFYKWQGKYNYELYFRDISTFKRAAGGFLRLLGLKEVTNVAVKENGQGLHYTLKNRADNWDNGELDASRHNALITEAAQDSLIGQNRQYIEEIIRKSAERGIKVLLINVPLYVSYRDTQNSEFLKQQRDFCTYFAKEYDNVQYFDFSDDPRFSDEDFYDASHLNEKGTKKFTLLLDSIMEHQSSPYMTKNLLVND